MSTAAKAVEKIATGDEDLLQLLQRAHSGDESTLPALRDMLKDPRTVDVLGGNLAETAEWAFVKNAAGKNLALREALVRKLELMRAELAGSMPTPVERLLVERVVACWLQVQDADARYAQGSKDATFAQSDHRQRRMDRAHNRYLSALRTLATVRKLAVPNLQINVANRQQVNNVTPSTG